MYSKRTLVSRNSATSYEYCGFFTRGLSIVWTHMVHRCCIYDVPTTYATKVPKTRTYIGYPGVVNFNVLTK